MFNAAVIFFCFFEIVTASVLIEDGPCPKIETMANFDPNKYIGPWYVVSHSINDSHNISKCVKENVTSNGNGTFSVVSSEIQRKSGTEIMSMTTLYPGNDTETAKMYVKKSEADPEHMYWVLDSDYQSYALIFQCRAVNQKHYSLVYYLTREQNPPESIFAKLDEFIEKYKFLKSNFGKIKQEDCELRPSK